jgi:hypothetical protein
VGELAGEFVGQYLVVGRWAALPFEFVHLKRIICYVARKSAGNRSVEHYLGDKSLSGQRVRRMGASRPTQSQSRDRMTAGLLPDF